MNYNQLIEAYVTEYENIFGHNIIETIDNIGDNDVQIFTDRWELFIKKDVNCQLNIDNTSLLNSKKGVATFLEYTYKRNLSLLRGNFRRIDQ